jgi:hypothetical protein
LLHVEVPLVGRGHRLAQLGQVLDALVHTQVGGVIAGRLGAQHQVVACVLLDRATRGLAPDDRLSQVVVEDLGLQARVGLLRDPPAEDQRDLVRVADRAVQVQQTLVQAVQRHTALEDQVGAILDLADEQAITEALVAALPVGEEGDQLRQPAMSAGVDVRRRELIGQFLQPRRVSAGAEGIGALLEGDALLAEPAGQPLVAVEADAAAEGEVGANTHEHPAEVPVLKGEVILLDEAVEQRDVIALAGEADGPARVLAALENDGHAALARQLLREGLDPFLTADAFGGCTISTCRCSAKAWTKWW